MGIFRRKQKAARKIADRFDRLQSDLDSLRKDAKQLAGGVGEMASVALEAAGEAYDDAGKWTTGNVRSVRSSVQTQPLTALLVSLSAGALLGALFVKGRGPEI